MFINRCAKVVKGGRRFSFSALIVAGDHDGKVGCRFRQGERSRGSDSQSVGSGAQIDGKDVAAREHDSARRRSVNLAAAAFCCVRLRPGTGVIAGGGVRAVVEAVGIRDVLAKSLGSSNHANVVKATIEALRSLRRRDEIFKVRGIRPSMAKTATERPQQS